MRDTSKEVREEGSGVVWNFQADGTPRAEALFPIPSPLVGEGEGKDASNRLTTVRAVAFLPGILFPQE